MFENSGTPLFFVSRYIKIPLTSVLSSSNDCLKSFDVIKLDT